MLKELFAPLYWIEKIFLWPMFFIAVYFGVVAFTITLHVGHIPGNLDPKTCEVTGTVKGEASC